MVQLIQTKMNLELNHVNLPIPYLHLLGFRLPFVFEKKTVYQIKIVLIFQLQSVNVHLVTELTLVI